MDSPLPVPRPHPAQGQAAQPQPRPRPACLAPSLSPLLHPSPQVPFPLRPRPRQPLKAARFAPQPQTSNNDSPPFLTAPTRVGQYDQQEHGEHRRDWLRKIRGDISRASRVEAQAEQDDQQPEQQETQSEATPLPLLSPLPYNISLVRPTPPVASPKATLAPPPSLGAQLSPPPSSRSPLAPSNPTSQPFSTLGLPPIRYPLRQGGSISILPSAHGRPGEVLLDWRERSGVVLVISGDGQVVSLFRRNLSKVARRQAEQEPLILLHPDEVYTCPRLPPSLEKSYALACKFVNGVRGRVPRMIVNLLFPSSSKGQPAILTIFSNSPSSSYSLSFPSPSPTAKTIRIDPSHNIALISISSTSSSARTVRISLQASVNQLATLAPPLQEAVRYAVELQQVVDRMVAVLDGSPIAAALAPAPRKERPSQDLPKLKREEKEERQRRRENTRSPCVLSGLVEEEEAEEAPIAARETHREGSATQGESTPVATAAQFSPSSSPVHAQQEDGEYSEERRHLHGAGWILRHRRAKGNTDEIDGWSYEVLFNDGEEVLLESERSGKDQRVIWRGQRYPLALPLPTRLERRMGLVEEMLALFGD